MEVQSLKEAISQMYMVCDQMEEKTNFREALGLQDGTSISNILKVNMLYYMAYLSASDGVISWDESRFIGEILDLHMTPPKLDELIRNQNIYSTEFEADPPIALKIFVAIDNAFYQNGIENKTELGNTLFELYRFLTVGLVEANGRTGETMILCEKENAQTYLGMMRDFIDNNTEKHHTDIILDYGKNQQETSNKKEGVRAPKKNGNTTGSVKAPKKKM